MRLTLPCLDHEGWELTQEGSRIHLLPRLLFSQAHRLLEADFRAGRCSQGSEVHELRISSSYHSSSSIFSPK